METSLETVLSAMPAGILLLCILGLLLLLGKGADLLVDEAVALSCRRGISKAAIGASVVALGTTLPEIAVSVTAALRGSPDLALGNAVGSVIANTGLIGGLVLLAGPRTQESSPQETGGAVRFQTLAAGTLMGLAFLSRVPGTGAGTISLWMGAVLLGVLLLYLRWFLSGARACRTQPAPDGGSLSRLWPGLRLAAGIALVVGSSRLLIPAVETLAVRAGIPQDVIAATLVAFGTSLPELVTAGSAIWKRHGDLAVGNILGANILNLLLVTGAATVVSPAGLAVSPSFYRLHFPVMLLLLLVFWGALRSSGSPVSRRLAWVLPGIYLLYLAASFGVLL